MTPDDQPDGDSDPSQPADGGGDDEEQSADDSTEQPGGGGDESTGAPGDESTAGTDDQASGQAGDDQPGQPADQPSGGPSGGRGGQPQGGQGQPGSGQPQRGEQGQPQSGGQGQGQGGQQGPQGGGQQPQGGQQGPQGGRGQPQGGQQRQPSQQPGGGRRPPEETTGAGGGSSTARRVGIILLGILLTVSLAGANVVFAGQRTALSADYVTNTMEEEGTFAQVESSAEEFVVAQVSGIEGAGYIPGSENLAESTVRQLITESYVEQVVTTNLQNLYDYLKGSTDQLRLFINTTPITSEVSRVVESKLENFPVTTLLQQPSFSDAFSFSVQGYRIDAGTIGRAYESESTYNRLQSNIRSALEQEGISREQLNETLRQQTPVSSLPDDLQQAIYRLEGVVVLAFTSDMSHDEFRRRMEAARDDFAAAAGAYAETQVEQQVPERIDLTDEISPQQRDKLEKVKGYVGLIGTISLVLPILALVCLLLIGYLTHSLSRTSRILGTSLLTVGVFGLVGTMLGSSKLRNAVSSANLEEFQDTAMALINGVISTLNTQFIVFTVLGILFVALWFAIQRLEPDAIPRSWH